MEKLLRQPLTDLGVQYDTALDFQEIRAQADEDAAAYLRSIHRAAEIAPRQSHQGKLIGEIVTDEDFLHELLKDDVLSRYPDWLGSCERVEDGERYIYQTAYDNEKQEIAYTKTAYDTKTMIESIIVDIQNKTITR